MQLLRWLGRRGRIGTVRDSALGPNEELGERLTVQGEKFLQTCSTLLDQHRMTTDSGDLETARSAVAAFQAVHVLSFLAVQKYLPEPKLDELFRGALSQLAGSDHHCFAGYVRRYETIKGHDTAEAFAVFGEDIGEALMGSPWGAMAGTGFAPMAQEFLLRNWAIAAHHFGDSETVEELRQAVMRIHET
jgi:hypothetical protein